MNFQYPFILFLSIPFLILWWIFLREKVGYSFPNSLMKKYSRISTKFMILWLVRCSIIFLTFLILSAPSYTKTEKKTLYSNKSITLVLDISKSMLADDISPSRLEWAKKVLISFLERESSNQFGLVICAGKAFTLSPLSYDRSAIINIIRNITTDTIKQQLPWLSGTNIGDALLAADKLVRSESGNNTVILITDGRANIGINPITSAEYLHDHKTAIYTIGIGESSGTILSYLDNDGKRQYFFDEKWEKLRADIDNVMLENIAKTTGGKFFQANDSHLFEKIFDNLSSELITKPEYYTEKKEINLTVPLFISLIVLIGFHTSFLFWMRKI